VRSKTFAARATCALALLFVCAAPLRLEAGDAVGQATDPAIARMVAAVSSDRLRATDTRLVAFGTRNLFSGRLHDGRRGVYATLRGDDPSAPTYVISSHYDSRNSDGNDATLDAPGADDNGSGVSAVLEAARLMTGAHFRGTIVFACFDGEQQGLFGSAHFARALHDSGAHVAADLNNDIIGTTVGHDGERDPHAVRLFSEALPVDANLRAVDAIGSENDSPSRELARAVRGTDEAYPDRFLRGGDQQRRSRGMRSRELPGTTCSGAAPTNRTGRARKASATRRPSRYRCRKTTDSSACVPSTPRVTSVRRRFQRPFAHSGRGRINPRRAVRSRSRG
jgi:hypothetical protein